MTLIEAIKSGRPFRRIDRNWLVKPAYRDAFAYYFPDGDTQPKPLSPDEITADDWETQEPAVTITRTQFWVAAKQAMINHGSTTLCTEYVLKSLAIALGLGEEK